MDSLVQTCWKQAELKRYIRMDSKLSSLANLANSVLDLKREFESRTEWSSLWRNPGK